MSALPTGWAYFTIAVLIVMQEFLNCLRCPACPLNQLASVEEEEDISFFGPSGFSVGKVVRYRAGLAGEQ